MVAKHPLGFPMYRKPLYDDRDKVGHCQGTGPCPPSHPLWPSGCSNPTARPWVALLPPAPGPESSSGQAAMIHLRSPSLHPVTHEGGEAARGDSICQRWQK